MTVAMLSMMFVISYVFLGRAIPARTPACGKIGAAPVDTVAPKPRLDRKQRHQCLAHHCRGPGTWAERKATTGQEPAFSGKPHHRVRNDGKRCPHGRCTSRQQGAGGGDGRGKPTNRGFEQNQPKAADQKAGDQKALPSKQQAEQSKPGSQPGTNAAASKPGEKNQPSATNQPASPPNQHAAQKSGHDGRARHIAAHAENGRGRADEFSAAQGSYGQSHHGFQSLLHADAVQTTYFDFLQPEPFRRHQLRLHSAIRSHKENIMPAAAEFPCDGQSGDHMATGTATGH